MKINLDDPRITAFALGELTGQDAVDLARAVRMDDAVRDAVDEVREVAALLGDTLTTGGAEMLTPCQREVVRNAGAQPVITDIASARVAFWKRPAVVAASSAAAVLAMFWLTGGDKPMDGGNDMVEQSSGIDWARIDTGVLMSPVILSHSSDHDAPGESEVMRQVSSAAREDTAVFREIVRKRIQQSEISTVDALPNLRTRLWHSPVEGERMAVPLFSGAASWPWINRYIEREGTLPPAQAVRIEEMINHFSYKKPTMMNAGGLMADVEMCQSPWNESAHLLAVHVQAQPGAKISSGQVQLVIQPDWVKKIRLLGYSDVDLQSGSGGYLGFTEKASRTRGNYVLYEVVFMDEALAEDGFHAVAVDLGGQESLVPRAPNVWEKASADLRFASVVAAAGMLLADYSDREGVDVAWLNKSTERLLQGEYSTEVTDERRQALRLLSKAANLLSVQ